MGGRTLTAFSVAQRSASTRKTTAGWSPHAELPRRHAEARPSADRGRPDPIAGEAPEIGDVLVGADPFSTSSAPRTGGRRLVDCGHRDVHAGCNTPAQTCLFTSSL